MIEECEYCAKISKKMFKKYLLLTKNEYKDFKASNKCWICKSPYENNGVKLKDHCHITHSRFNIFSQQM